MNEFKIEAKKLYWRFKERGFSHNCLKKAYKRSLESDRNLLLIPKKSQQQNDLHPKIVRLIGDYSKEHKEIKQILHKHWHTLQQDNDLHKVIGDRPRGKFIKEYKIKIFINCKTSGIVYFMQCNCSKKYVGKTIREFRRRIMEHVGDVKHKRNTSIANHVNEIHSGDTNTMTFIGIERVDITTRIGDPDRKPKRSRVDL
ncbi:hypothetical protein XELAEV_18032754mg [Xenopus laevis]|uniref:GIY-YIG domain-containing protein n=1 Tax=Xenopus laevis TaxID=8355 RepID=A0A974HDD2_XENLA|nr:hypothetical protein XELAEV_18032754mg [Xenopus laevis]